MSFLFSNRSICMYQNAHVQYTTGAGSEVGVIKLNRGNVTRNMRKAISRLNSIAWKVKEVFYNWNSLFHLKMMIRYRIVAMEPARIYVIIVWPNEKYFDVIDMFHWSDQYPWKYFHRQEKRFSFIKQYDRFICSIQW